MENIYKNHPDKWKEFSNEYQRGAIPMLSFSLFLALGFNYLINPSVFDPNSFVLPAFVILIIVSLIIGYSIAIKKQKEIYDQYNLILSDNKIIINGVLGQTNIDADQIDSIGKLSSGQFVISIQNKKKILLSKYLENSETLIKDLSKFSEVTHAEESKNKIIKLLVSIMSILAMLTLLYFFYTSTNPVLVLIIGLIILFVCLPWILFFMKFPFFRKLRILMIIGFGSFMIFIITRILTAFY